MIFKAILVMGITICILVLIVLGEVMGLSFKRAKPVSSGKDKKRCGK